MNFNLISYNKFIISFLAFIIIFSKEFIVLNDEFFIMISFLIVFYFLQKNVKDLLNNELYQRQNSIKEIFKNNIELKKAILIQRKEIYQKIINLNFAHISLYNIFISQYIILLNSIKNDIIKFVDAYIYKYLLTISMKYLLLYKNLIQQLKNINTKNIKFLIKTRFNTPKKVFSKHKLIKNNKPKIINKNLIKIYKNLIKYMVTNDSIFNPTKTYKHASKPKLKTTKIIKINKKNKINPIKPSIKQNTIKKVSKLNNKSIKADKPIRKKNIKK